jgi:16S rRNA (cytosine1402-N4)-methyltransferase
MPSPTVHTSVLAAEVLEGLDPRPGQIVVDGTLGGGGHTRLILERMFGGDAPAADVRGFVLALDQDPLAIARAEENFQGWPLKVAQANFRNLPDVLDELELPAVDSVLLDIGLSSDQLADHARGFSFQGDGELDMRFNPDEGIAAWQLLERESEEKLADLIFQYGEEHYSRRIAKAIVATRKQSPIRTAQELSQLIRRVVPPSKDKHIDPATRTFQALRIAVNDELGALRQSLERIPRRLKLGGRFAIISFHSLEDRLVKDAFRENPRLKNLTKKPIIASPEEQNANPRSRSAKLRIAQRVAAGSLEKIISGGQTGVDRAALDAAMAINLPHGGYCPRRRQSEDGGIPPIYALVETDSPLYHVRTERNVQESDATLILHRGPMKGGTDLTRKFAEQHKKILPPIDLTRPPSIGPTVELLRAMKIKQLNIAGPRESGSPGIYDVAKAWILKLLMELV